MSKNSRSKSSRKPRRPEPFFRTQTQSWYVQLQGRQINLGRDKEAAWAKYNELMVSCAGRSVGPHVPVAELLDEFLEHVKQNRAESTFLWYRNYLRSFVQHFGRRTKVYDLRPFHVTKWLDESFAHLGNTSRNCAVRAVRSAFNWSVSEGYLTISPVRGVKRPPANRREMVLTEEQFEKIILERVSDDYERDLVVFLWETGARVQEVRRIEAGHVQVEASRAVLPPSADKTGHYRVIYLTEKARTMVERLSKGHLEGPIFRNRLGKPWTSNAIRCRFRKFGVNGLCGTTLRHSFCQRMLTNGVDSLTVSVLMGHRDLTMVASTYSHLARDAGFLRAQLNGGTKGVGVSAGAPIAEQTERVPNSC